MGTADRMKAMATTALKPGSDEDAAEVGTPSEAEAMWAAMTIPHHRTGIRLAELALARAQSERVRELAAHTKQEQEDDLPTLQKFLDAGGTSPMPPPAPIEKLEQLDLAMLEQLSGEQFDQTWLMVQSSHHMAALLQGENVMAVASTPAVLALLKKMRSAQLSELETMNDLRG